MSADAAPQPAPPDLPSPRYVEVSRVLWRVLALNLAVAAAKIGFGYASGAVSVLSDGFHSLTDASSNVIALVGVRVASKPPDRDHPYGHRKYETIAAAAIMAMLLIAVVEVLRASVSRLWGGSEAHFGPAVFVVMIGTLAVNLVVVAYERRQGKRLVSEVLLADARHTSSDVLTSLGVIAALIGVRIGWPVLDPLAGLLVAGFIGHAGYEIAREAERILADRVVFEEGDVHRIVMAVPGVLGCHQIRSRGSRDHVFLDLHIFLRPDTRLDAAHAVSHVVKDRLRARFPQIVDAVIHIEPPPDTLRPAWSPRS